MPKIPFDGLNDDAGPPNVLLPSVGIGYQPMAGFQLHRDFAGIADVDGVCPEVLALIRIGPILGERRRDADADAARDSLIHGCCLLSGGDMGLRWNRNLTQVAEFVRAVCRVLNQSAAANGPHPVEATA